jgi:iron complex outermembrane receptor protein
LRIIGNFEISRTNNKSSSNKNLDKQLPYIPKSAGNLFLHLNHSIFEVDWNWNYYSKRFTTTANSEETISDYLYPYFMNNVQFGISVPKGKNKLSCMLKVLNVFDEDYRTVLQRPMPGRNYQIVFQYGF